MLDRFSTNIQIKNFIKIRSVGDELFDVDGRTDTTKVIIAFRNVANSHKNIVIRKMFEPTTKSLFRILKNISQEFDEKCNRFLCLLDRASS